MLHASDLEVFYLKNGSSRYQIELSHEGLRKHKIIKGDDPGVVRRKAQLQIAAWEEKWSVQEAKAREEKRKIKNQTSAEEQTKDAQTAFRIVESLLDHTLTLDDTIEWDSLKDSTPFATPAPKAPDAPVPPPKPLASDGRYAPELGLFDRLIRSRKDRKIDEARERWDADIGKWETAVADAEATAARLRSKHELALAGWRTAKRKYEQDRDAANVVIDQEKKAWLARDPAAVSEYCELVLSRSQYPDSFPQEFELDFNPETGLLLVDYLLPAIDDLPTLKEVTYVKSRDELKVKHLSDREKKKLYDGALYEITLRTIHELFEADRVEALQAVVFNGFVKNIDPATGQQVEPCILSVQARREEFLAIDLRHVEPKACFKSLKGVGSSKLHTVTAVAPLVQVNREDSRLSIPIT